MRNDETTGPADGTDDAGDAPFSATGARRREEILGLARAAARGRRRRRVVAKFAAGGACAAVAAVALLLVVRGAGPQPAERIARETADPRPPVLPRHSPHRPQCRRHPRRRRPPPSPPTARPRRRPAIVVVRIETDPTLSDRLAVPRPAADWQRLDDDALVAALARTGRPAGLAHVGGRALLLPRSNAFEGNAGESSGTGPEW